MTRSKKKPEQTLDELTALWVREHGEAVTVKEAARLMGVHPQTIHRRVWAGKIKETPDKRVLIRSLCYYANGVTA